MIAAAAPLCGHRLTCTNKPNITNYSCRNSGAGNSNRNRLDKEDDCYADLNPAITVTVTFFSARSAGSSEPFAVIRQRIRSDCPYPDRGQMMTWRLRWEHTAMLVEEAHGGADADIAEITRAEAGQITAGLAARHWPPETVRLPWVACAYPR
jgi:hypothetical protein